MDFLYAVTVDPFLQLTEDPVFFVQVLLFGVGTVGTVGTASVCKASRCSHSVPTWSGVGTGSGFPPSSVPTCPHSELVSGDATELVFSTLSPLVPTVPALSGRPWNLDKSNRIVHPTFPKF